MREMKDSGIEWVGKVPKIWSLKPIRALFDEVTEKNFLGTCSNALKFTYGSIVRKPNFDADADDYVASTILNYTVVEPGTIMLNGLNLNFDFVSQRIGLVKEKGVITSAYMAFKPNEKQLIDSEFATYLFKAYDGCKAFHNMGGGVRKILNFNEFKKYYIPLPDLNEQQHIVDFLDTKCSEIDVTAEDIQKEISLLEDYKKSVITEAVTKGLNPDAEMKDSGIEWIGEIPKDWKVIKTKYVADISIGLVTTMTANYVDNLDDGVYLIRNGDIRLNKISKEKMVYISRKFVEQNASRQLLENDIVTVHTGYIGTSAIIRDDFIGSVGFATIQSRPNLNIINERYLCWFYNSSFFIKQCMLHNTGDGRQNLNLYDFVDFYVYQPPLAEQQQIADHLDTQCSEIDTLIADKKRQLDILADYKKSLIYEYVTGKKEVPVNE